MANANQGIKKAARIGWEQKLLRLCQADKYNIGKVPGTDDGKYLGWTQSQYEEVLKLHGFDIQYSYQTVNGKTVRDLLFVKGKNDGNARKDGGKQHRKPAPLRAAVRKHQFAQAAGA